MTTSVTCNEMRDLETRAFRDGWTAEQLMDLAGEALARRMMVMMPAPGTVIAYLGKGHNAGDALVALRVLRDAGWRIGLRAAYPSTEWSVLARRKYREAGEIETLRGAAEVAGVPGKLVLLDGLLGIGARGAPRGVVAEFAAEMNSLRLTRGARTVAVDIPSGVDADLGTPYPGAVVADITLTVGAVKCGLLAESAANHVGRIALVPVAALAGAEGGALSLITPDAFPEICHPAASASHKGMLGRVAVVAGSGSYTGAAVLAATGALRAGAGLVTLHVFPEIHSVVAAKAPPEVIVMPCEDAAEVMDMHCDAIVVGPGLGDMRGSRADAILEIVHSAKSPLVVDADALNLLARERPGWVPRAGCVWTPHPGEFRRLAPDLADMAREVAARSFADRGEGVLLLKGARTLVTRRGESLWCNATGTPGMASGGQGDVLSGVIAALLARGTPALAAACAGAWLCGRAAERAVCRDGMSDESLTAGDTAAALGGAFLDWRERTR